MDTRTAVGDQQWQSVLVADHWWTKSMSGPSISVTILTTTLANSVADTIEGRYPAEHVFPGPDGGPMRNDWVPMALRQSLHFCPVIRDQSKDIAPHRRFVGASVRCIGRDGSERTSTATYCRTILTI